MAKIIGLPKDKDDQECLLSFLNKDFTDFMQSCSYRDSYKINLKSDSSDTTIEIFLSLVLGDKNACLFFSLSFLNDRGVKTDQQAQDFLNFLSISIAIETGDKSIVKLAEDDDISKDSPQAWALADKCIGLMQRNYNEVGQKHVLFSEALARAKAFDEVVKKASGYSIFDNILPGVFHLERYVETLYPKGFNSANIHNIKPLESPDVVAAAAAVGDVHYDIPAHSYDYNPHQNGGDEVSLAGQPPHHSETPCCPKHCVLL